MLTFDKFIETIDRLEEARILLAALEFKVFTHLGKRSMTVQALARRCKAKKEGMEALLNALVTLKALTLISGKYANTPEMYKHFCESSPDYKKGMVMLRKENHDEYADLIQVIKKGRKTEEVGEPDDPGWRRLFTHAMNERSEKPARKVAEVISKKPVGRLLDLGGGPASYSAAILKKDKRAEATVLDRKAALKVARELWKSSPIWSRLDLMEGDLFDAEYGEGFDTVLFSNILHIYNTSQNRTLIRKISKSLNPGGRIVLVDYFLNPNRTGPYHASMFSLTMLLFTETGRTYTWDETENLLSGAGFKSFKRHAMEGDWGILVGIKA